MIARIWHGRTPHTVTESYTRYVQETGIPALEESPGNRGTYLLRGTNGDVTDFLVLSLWGSMDEIRDFAGPDPEKPVYFPRDDEFLLELEPVVRHYEVADAGSEG